MTSDSSLQFSRVMQTFFVHSAVPLSSPFLHYTVGEHYRVGKDLQ